MEEQKITTLQEFARAGGNAVKSKYGASHFSKLGKKGGAKNKAKGPEYFKKLSKMGVSARKKMEA